MTKSKSPSFLCGFGRSQERIERYYNYRKNKYGNPIRILTMPSREEFIKKIKQHKNERKNININESEFHSR